MILPPLRRLFLRVLLVGAAAFALLLAFVLVDGWRGFGAGATGARLARMQKSPQWKNGHFENPQPLINDWWGSISGAFETSAHVSPEPALQFDPIDPARFAAPPPSGLRITWLGHSTLFIEIDGLRILTDPVWSQRTSPLTWIGPVRWYGPLIALKDLPPVDAVIISHDHYDHLDEGTLTAMKDWKTKFIVPLGVGAHLASWGVPEASITEVDWWDDVPVGALTIHATPARHASGRNAILDKDATLWAGYALTGPAHRVYFSGDTGLFPAMRDIGSRYGPFDMTFIETGQYHRAWPDWHIGPEQAVRANELVGGRVLMPIHWALFALAYHGWTEPGERALAEAQAKGATIALPKPGESFEPATFQRSTRWWPDVPWQTAAEHPIVSSQMN